MTKLYAGSEDCVVRETSVIYRGSTLIVELHPSFLVLRRKGKRERWVLDYEVGHECAQKVWAREQGVKV